MSIKYFVLSKIFVKLPSPGPSSTILNFLGLPKVFQVDIIHIPIISEKDARKLKADYYNWGNAKIAHKSNLLLNTSILVNLRDKIRLRPVFQYIGKQKAFILIEQELDSRLHFHLELEYN